MIERRTPQTISNNTISLKYEVTGTIVDTNQSMQYLLNK